MMAHGRIAIAFWNPVIGPELEHPSDGLVYSTCKCGPAVQALEAAIERGLFTAISSPPAAVLRRILQAARVAKGMPPLAKRWIADDISVQQP